MLRLFASPQGPGLLQYLLSVTHMIDLLSIMPFYITIIAHGAYRQLAVLELLRTLRILRQVSTCRCASNPHTIVLSRSGRAYAHTKHAERRGSLCSVDQYFASHSTFAFDLQYDDHIPPQSKAPTAGATLPHVP